MAIGEQRELLLKGIHSTQAVLEPKTHAIFSTYLRVILILRQVCL